MSRSASDLSSRCAAACSHWLQLQTSPSLLNNVFRLVVSEVVLAPEPICLATVSAKVGANCAFGELPAFSRFEELCRAVTPSIVPETAQSLYSVQSDCIPKQRGRNQPDREQDGKHIAVTHDLSKKPSLTSTVFAFYGQMRDTALPLTTTHDQSSESCPLRDKRIYQTNTR